MGTPQAGTPSHPDSSAMSALEEVRGPSRAPGAVNTPHGVLTVSIQPVGKEQKGDSCHKEVTKGAWILPLSADNGEGLLLD